MKVSQILSEEHKNILFMIEIMKKSAINLQHEPPTPIDELSKLVDFLKYYADSYHHGKEEDILFPKYAEAGVPNEQGPIGVMLNEHVLGRGYIKGMYGAIEDMNSGKDSKKNFIQNAELYYELLKNHIHKEDNILYPMGDSRLSDADQLELSNKFEEFESKKFKNVPKLKEVLDTLNSYKIKN